MEEKSDTSYQISDRQKKVLDEMGKLNDEDFISSEEFHKNIKGKYGFI